MRRFFLYLRDTLWRARVKTCCSIAPLRIGLVCLASLNLIIALVQIVGTANGATNFMPILAHIEIDILEEPSKTSCVLPPATELAFNAVLLAALFRRDTVLLGAYCCYVLGTIFLSFVVYGLLEAVINPLYLFVIILNGIYQIFMLVLVRSLMVEIQLKKVSDRNGFIYNKDQGVVIIRDVESPAPGAIGMGHLPALPEPGMTTSITTLATLNEQTPETQVDSIFSTLNKNHTLKTSTLKSYKTNQDVVDVHTQRSATLPYKETPYVHKPINTQRVGAIQSLAGPSYKSIGSNNNTLNRETSVASATVTSAESTNINKPVATDSDIKEDNTKDNTTVKPEEIPQKKRRGIFSRASKEQNIKKGVETTPSSASDIASTSKPSTSKNDTMKKEVNSTGDSPADNTTKENENVEVLEEKKEDASQKKKRGLFSKAPKENKQKEKKEKREKGVEQ